MRPKLKNVVERVGDAEVSEMREYTVWPIRYRDIIRNPVFEAKRPQVPAMAQYLNVVYPRVTPDTVDIKYDLDICQIIADKWHKEVLELQNA